MEYDVLGIRIALESNVASVVQCVTDTYSAFREAPSHHEGVYVVRLDRGAGGFRLQDSLGLTRSYADENAALLGTLERLTQLIVDGLAGAGMLVLHAAAAAHGGRALIIAGPSGSGKTTLVLGLVSRGLTLLSDELALVAREGEVVLPYPRSLHIRPGTPELIPALAYLANEPRRHLGGGIKWSVTPAALERAMPMCLADPAPLGHVLLLERPSPRDRGAELVPVAPGVTVVELLRGAPAAGRGLRPVLRRLSEVAAAARCARLRPGPLAQSLDLVSSWLLTGR